MQIRLLIQQAYRWAEILAEEGEEASSTQLNTGLNLFNKMVRRISIDGIEIGLISSEQFNLTAGVETFDLPDYTKLEKVQYKLGGIRFDIRLLSLNQYRNYSRILNNSGIPYVGYPQRTPTGISLQLFFKPVENYELFVDGYKTLPELTLEDTPTDIEKFMEDYLEIQLASDLRDFYQKPPNVYLVRQVEMYVTKLKNIKEHRIDVHTHLTNTDDMIYAKTPWLNLSGGWMP